MTINSNLPYVVTSEAMDTPVQIDPIKAVALVLQQAEPNPLLIDNIDIHHKILKQFTSFKQFGKYASTNKATYELVKDFGFNVLRDSLKDGSFYRIPAPFYKNKYLMKLAQKRFKRLAPLNRDISLMVDPDAIFADRNNSLFLNTLAFEHPEVYISSLKAAISNGFNREAFLEGLTQNDIVIISNEVDESVFSGKETILFQNPSLKIQIMKVLCRGLMDALSHPYFNTSAQNNLAIRFASENRQTEIVKLLLTDERVDRSARDNYSIRWASVKGCTEIVKLLLQDSRVDPSALDNFAIRWASENGFTEVVKLLENGIMAKESQFTNEFVYSNSL